MRLSYHPDTEAELAEAARVYERKVPGLGARFRSEFESAVARILETPDRWRILEKDIRRFLMRRFPYSPETTAIPEGGKVARQVGRALQQT
jgi:toxin ParE1/3/4